MDTARFNNTTSKVDQFGPNGAVTFQRLGGGFDEAGYAAANPDVAGSGMTGQQHFEKYGRNENRQGMGAGYTPGNADRWAQTTMLSPAQAETQRLTDEASGIYGNAAVRQLRAASESLSQPFQFGGRRPDEYAPEIMDATNRNTNGVRTDMPNRAGEVRDYSENLVDRGGEVRRDFDFARYGDPNVAREDVQRALFARNEPLLERDRAALEQRLANQGITYGSEAFRAAMDDDARARNDSRNTSILNAGQEQNRIVQLAGMDMDARNNATGLSQNLTNSMQGQRQDMANSATSLRAGMDAQSMGFNNAALAQRQNMMQGGYGFAFGARNQGMQEALAMRNQPINEASALLSGNMIRMPEFGGVPTAQMAPADYQSAVGQQVAAQNAAFQAASANAASRNQGMASIVGAGAQVGAAFFL